MDPIFSFGIISDIQYADVNDGHNFHKTKVRYYRNAVNLCANAVKCWQNSSCNVEFILQLGDIIDGRAKNQSERALNTVLDQFSDFRDKTIHVLGNHELYNFSRAEINKGELFSPNFLPKCSTVKDRLYYTFSPHTRLKIVVLDCYEIGVLGYKGDETEYQVAARLLNSMNPNTDKHDNTGMHDLDRRFVKYNGGIAEEQLNWLDQQLTESTNNSQNVIVAGHVPIHPSSTYRSNLTWNYEEVMGVLGRHDCVIGCLSGHTHTGGAASDDRGVQFIVFPAILESLKEDVFATANLYRDRIEIIGHGQVDSFTLNLKYQIADENEIIS